MELKMMRTLGAIAMLAAAPTAGAIQIEDRVCREHLVSVTPEGEVTRGSKALLVQAVESGRTIRVGFGLGTGNTGGFSLTHWFDAKFLTVMGEEVFTQTPIIHSQRPVRGAAPDIDFPDAASQWVATLGTNGQLHSKGLTADDVGDFKVYSWWCLSD